MDDDRRKNGGVPRLQLRVDPLPPRPTPLDIAARYADLISQLVPAIHRMDDDIVEMKTELLARSGEGKRISLVEADVERLKKEAGAAKPPSLHDIKEVIDEAVEEITDHGLHHRISDPAPKIRLEVERVQSEAELKRLRDEATERKVQEKERVAEKRKFVGQVAAGVLVVVILSAGSCAIGRATSGTATVTVPAAKP